MTVSKRQDWYRKQCALFSVRLGEWLDDNPQRKTKGRQAIVEAEQELGRNFKDDEEAYQALIAVEDMMWVAPKKAARVIFNAMRPSESYNKWLKDTQTIKE